LIQACAYVFWLHFHRRRNLTYARIHILHQTKGDFTRHRFNAAHARSHAALGDDLEEADVAGAGDVRATAEFFAAADFEHANG